MAERKPFPWGKPVPKVTIEEMHFAIVLAAAVSSGSMPIEGWDKGVGASKLTRQVFAIAAALKHDPVKASAAAYRDVFIASEVFADARVDSWLSDGEGRMMEIHPALVEAIATVPSTFGKIPPMDRVFRLAESIKAKMSVTNLQS